MWERLSEKQRNFIRTFDSNILDRIKSLDYYVPEVDLTNCTLQEIFILTFYLLIFYLFNKMEDIEEYNQ